MKQNKLKTREPWTEDEDSKLKNYFHENEEGHWDTVARKLDLRRSANSTRLRWINYLKPGVRRHNITDEEMLSILLLQFKWGNKWSKIARELIPAGRRDNEIKNFWNTRVKKEANELNCKLGSKEFLTTMVKILLKRIKSVDSSLFSPTAYDELMIILPQLRASAAEEQFLEEAMQPSLPPSAVAGGSAEPTADYSGFLDQEYVDFGLIWCPDNPNNYVCGDFLG